MDAKEFLEKEFPAFAWAMLQDFRAFILYIRERGFTVDEILNMITEEQERRQAQTETEIVKVPCPECDGMLYLRDIRIPKGKNNVYGYRSAFVCSKCTFERFSVLTPEKLYANYRIKGGFDGLR